MADREKVIRGLECCTTFDSKGFPLCEECPYADDGTCPELDQLHRDALELLKEQEPRVMTLEEASFRLGEPVWVEKKASDVVYCEVLFDVDGKAFKLTFGSIEFGGLLTGHSLISVEPYGRDFRFWTSRPTDEQRKATLWEPPKEG